MMNRKRYLVRVYNYYDTPDDRFIRKDYEVKFFANKSDAERYIEIKRENIRRDNFVMINDFDPNIEIFELNA